jgi:hypothetical protein
MFSFLLACNENTHILLPLFELIHIVSSLWIDDITLGPMNFEIIRQIVRPCPKYRLGQRGDSLILHSNLVEHTEIIIIGSATADTMEPCGNE